MTSKEKHIGIGVKVEVLSGDYRITGKVQGIERDLDQWIYKVRILQSGRYSSL